MCRTLTRRICRKICKKLAALSDLILFSAAITHQGGTNHLNERPLQYWNELFKKEGFYCFDILREKLWDNPDIEWWYRQNIAIFAKNKALDILKQQGYNETDFLNTYYHPELVKKILSRK